MIYRNIETMTIILLIGFFMAIFLLALVLGKKNKANFDKVFVGMLAVYALTIGGTYLELFNVENNYPYPHLMNVNWLFLLLHGPLLWFYVKTLTQLVFKLKPIHLLHFAPFVFYSIFHWFNFIELSAEEKIMYVSTSVHYTTILVKIGSSAVGISSITYNIVALFLLQKHLRNIKNTFSNIENKDLKWLKTLVIASLIVFLVNVLLFNLNNYFRFSEYFVIAKIAYTFSTVYVLYIGYFGIRQGRIFADYPIIEESQLPKAVKQPTQNDVKKNYSEIIDNLTRLMEKDQPYLDPELNLARLSNLMKTKPELISEVLNSALNQNFFDFINKYRIEEFKLKCLSKENRHLSIMGIAYECGFNSKAAFYRAFNKFEAMSPTAYISQVS
jgi:AraC-like DNA-binding protein